MTRSMLRVLPAALVAVLVIAPATAHAAGPIVTHENVSDFQPNQDLCGINVDVTTKGVFTDKLFLNAAGDFDHFSSTASFKTTFVADNGKAIILQSAGQFVDPGPAIDEAAGTITFSISFKGLPEKISTAHGPVLLRDAGVITFSDTFDLTTFEHISSDVVIHGPHPEADSDFALFCEVIIAALA